MLFNLTWRYRQKIGEIEIREDKIIKLIELLAQKGDALELAPAMRIKKDKNGNITDVEITEMSLVMKHDNIKEDSE